MSERVPPVPARPQARRTKTATEPHRSVTVEPVAPVPAEPPRPHAPLDVTTAPLHEGWAE